MIGDCAIRDCGEEATMQLMGRWSGPVLAVCHLHAETLRAYRAGRTRLITRVWTAVARRPRKATWDDRLEAFQSVDLNIGVAR